MNERHKETVEELYLAIIGELAERAQFPRSEALTQCAAEYQERLAVIDWARAELDALLDAEDECAPLQRLMGGYEALASWAFQRGYRYGQCAAAAGDD